MRLKLSCLLLILAGFLLQFSNLLAQERDITVVASQSILADVTRNVAGDNIQVSSLIPVGADPHSFIPSPSDLTAIANADLVLLNGAGYEEDLLKAIENAGEHVNIVVASACIEILPLGATMHAEQDHEGEMADGHDDDHADEHDDDHADEQDDDHADEHDDDHADEHDEMAVAPDCDDHDAELSALIGEEEEHGHEQIAALGREMYSDCGGGHAHEDEHGHEKGGCDAHVWMDPHNVIYWTLMIRDALIALDHDNGEIFAANATIYTAELAALESDFILPALEGLPQDNRVLVSNHESLGYFAATFDFELITTIVPGISTLVEPSARDIAALIDLVRSEGVPAIFGDSFSQNRVLSTIAGETGISVFGLYSDSLSDSDGPAATYLDFMRYNVTTIVDALMP